MKPLTPENKMMLEITDWAFKFAEGEIDSTTFMSETMQILTANTEEDEGSGMFCKCGCEVERLDTRSEPEGIRDDAYCPECKKIFACHKFGFVEIPNTAEDDIDNDRDYLIAQVLERELDDSITIANIMSGIQHALNTAEDKPKVWKTIQELSQQEDE